jgi:hypothetical protein
MTELEKLLTEIARDLERVEKKINNIGMLNDRDLSMLEGRLLGLTDCYKKVKAISYFLDKVKYLSHLTKDFKDYNLEELEDLKI